MSEKFVKNLSERKSIPQYKNLPNSNLLNRQNNQSDCIPSESHA